MTFTDVVWDSSVNTHITINGATVTRNTGSGWNNNQGVARTASSSVFNTSTQLGSVKGTINALYTMIGIAQNPFQDENMSFKDMEFGMYGDEIYESGTAITPDVSFSRTSSSDTFETKLCESGEVKYYYNGSLVHTSTKTASGNYYPFVAIENTGGGATVQQELVATYQQLKVEFFPTNNVQDPAGSTSGNVQLKVEFYPTSNVQDTGTGSVDNWKWWLGMRGKRRYGNKAIKRISL